MASPPFSVASGGALKRRGLRDDVYDRILDFLLAENVAPGTRLSIDGIARDLQVSPTPVREALIQLERTGLVTREALKGYRVAPPPTHEQLDALFDSRLILECGAIGLVEQRTEGLLDRLATTLRDQRAAVDALKRAPERLESLRRYFAIDAQFHEQIFTHTGNPFLCDMYDQIGSQVHRMRQLVLMGTTDADDALREHAEVLEALRSGVPGAGTDAMRQHLQNVRRRAHSDTDDPRIHDEETQPPSAG